MGITNQMQEGAEAILWQLGTLKAGETVCIVADPTTEPVGQLLRDLAEKGGARVHYFCIPAMKIHGQEPPPEVANAMAASDIIFGVTFKSMAHTKARLNACSGRSRYLSLPEYNLELLTHPALRIDYPKEATQAKVFADLFTRGARVTIKTPAGTDLSLDISGRTGNFCPGYVNEHYKLGSPPDIESNVSPVEDGTNGVLICDGSIPYPNFGKLDEPLKLTIQAGKIVHMEGPSSYVNQLESLFTHYGERSRVFAECGIGFNSASQLCGNMLLDEGCLGTFHAGFGSNATVGGKNDVPFHLDFIYYAQTISIDGVDYTVKKG